MKRNKQLISLIRKCEGKTVKFRDLPSTAKYAMSHYMAIDGEAWRIPLNIVNYLKNRNFLENHYPNSKTLIKLLINNIGFYTKLYGNKEFGLVNIPTEKLLAFFCKGVYPKSKEMYEKRKEIWPVILEFSPVNEDNPLPIQDGWHRLSDYVAMGLNKIPCLYYLENQKYY